MSMEKKQAISLADYLDAMSWARNTIDDWLKAGKEKNALLKKIWQKYGRMVHGQIDVDFDVVRENDRELLEQCENALKRYYELSKVMGIGKGFDE